MLQFINVECAVGIFFACDSIDSVVGLSQCELVVKVIGEVVNAQFWAELLRCVFSGEIF